MKSRIRKDWFAGVSFLSRKTKRKICKRILSSSIFLSFSFFFFFTSLFPRVLFVSHILTHDIFMGERNFTRRWIKVLFRPSPFFLVIFAEAGSAYTSLSYDRYIGRFDTEDCQRGYRWEWRIVFFLGGIGGKIWREMPMRKVCEYFLYIRAYLLRVLFQSLTIFSNFLTIFARCLKENSWKSLSRRNKGKEFLDSTFSNLSRILKIDANDVINKTFRCPLEKSCTISPSKLKSSFLS